MFQTPYEPPNRGETATRALRHSNERLAGYSMPWTVGQASRAQAGISLRWLAVPEVLWYCCMSNGGVAGVMLSCREEEGHVRSHDEVLAQVKRANERFYRAFESLRIEEMSAMWVHAERARCVHPGWDVLEGWEAIRQSWEAIFANTDYMRFVLTDVAVSVDGSMAWVTCVENLSDAPETRQVARILSTNIYEQHDDSWRIVHHHASLVLRPARALEGFGPESLN